MNPEKRRARAKRKAKALRNGTFRRTAEGRGKLKRKLARKALKHAPLYTVLK